MVIGIDFDGTIVSQVRQYHDLATPLEFMPGAKESLAKLKAAGHVLLLYSARASRSIREDPFLDPLVRAGVRKVNMQRWLDGLPLHVGRYQEMLNFVAKELPGVFDAIDDGQQGKPSGVDLFIDDRALRFDGSGGLGYTWEEIASIYGAQPKA